jgi:hypothetical protein
MVEAEAGVVRAGVRVQVRADVQVRACVQMRDASMPGRCKCERMGGVASVSVVCRCIYISK